MAGRDRLHRLVWINDVDGMRDHLATEEGRADLNRLDVRGNAPLHLAAMLNRKEAAQVLLEAGADILLRNRQGWFPDHEARSVGDRDLIRLYSLHRRIQMEKYFAERAGKLMEQLAELDDFYMEMRWDFSSWGCVNLATTVPLVSQFCPSDVYRFYKKTGPHRPTDRQGSAMRVDTTLVGFENLKWLRGNISYMFAPNSDGGADFVLIDHDNKLYEHASAGKDDQGKIEDRVNFLMNMPVRVATPLVDKVKFEVKKSGILGFGASKLERVGDYDAEVYTLSNFKIRAPGPKRHRHEHLDAKLVPKDGTSPASPSRDLSSASASASLSKLSLASSATGDVSNGGAAPGSPDGADEPSKDALSDLLDAPMDADAEDAQASVLAKLEGKKDSDVEAFYRNARAKAMRFRPSLLPPPPPPVDFQSYFLPELSNPSTPIPRSHTPTPAVAPGTPVAGEAPYIHVGRPVQQKEVTQNVKATLWMSTSFPLFVEQLFPILTIMSPTNEHFARFKDFVDLKLPRGFPVKVEIPLFGVLTAKITFQAYRLDRNLDPALFKLDPSYVEGEVKFRGM